MATYDGPIVDVDIHHRPKFASELAEYLPKGWQDNLRGNLPAIYVLQPPGSSTFALVEYGGRRGDTVQEGITSGYSYDLLKRDLLDRFDYFKGIITHDLGDYSAHANHYLVRELARAANEWTIERWLSRDERLSTVVVVPTGEPEEAAKEIRRIGGHERFVAVLFAGNPLGRAIGDPIYHPIYEAAAEMGLGITVHPATDRPNSLTGVVGGPPGSTLEYSSQCSQQAMHYISSLIVHGVFEKWPDLHVMVKEYGVAWLPSLMWRLDAQHELLKRESPWVKKLPSEYIRKHVKLSTQPIEESPVKGGTAAYLQTVEGIEDCLCFSTDYPHYTMDLPAYVATLLPDEWHRKVFCDNACDFYGWTPPAAATTETAVAA